MHGLTIWYKGTRMLSVADTLSVGDGLPHASPAAPPARYINRELSWLDFNDRVVALAGDGSLPILERAKFLAIASRNLDEYFQVRVAGLREQVNSGLQPPSMDGLSPGAQLRMIRDRTLTMTQRMGDLFTQSIAPGLNEVGIRFSDWRSLDSRERPHLDRAFDEHIFPVLTPLAVDPMHPFPYISNLSLNLAVVLRDPAADEQHLARIKVPQSLPRFFVMPDGERYVPLEQVIAAHLASLFPGMEIIAHHPFRVTRSADFQVDQDDADDLLEAVRDLLKRRRRSALVVRLEVHTTMAQEVRELLLKELELVPEDIFVTEAPLDLGGLWSLADLDRAELKFAPWVPTTQPRLATSDADATADLFQTLREGEILVHHPYEAFETSVDEFIERAADDPHVLAIKQTLYRTSGPVSPIIHSLIRAAEAGKQVVALIELTARFDEQANIEWARLLEQAGVHVVYGIVGLKTHAKISLVVRSERGELRRYCHVATGNYNADTARVYEDVGILSADPELCADLSNLFNVLTGYSHLTDYRRILVAPRGLRPTLLDLIRNEANPGGRIVLKINSLADAEIIDALGHAARAGGRIDIIVRGICCLRPGVPELSEGIRIRSIVGRFLEHSRIMRFGTPETQVTHLIGSADLMQRNLDKRVETAIPVLAPESRARLDEILEANLADDVLAWELNSTGEWRKVPTTVGVNAQTRLQQLALERSHGPH